MLLGGLSPISARGADMTPSEARAIAKEAYTYGFPLVDNYRIMFAYWIDKSGPEYKGSINTIQNSAHVYGPEDKAIQTPNSDTPYSFAWLDLRADPMVLTLPAVEKDRYYSVQLIDSYTYNFDYLGIRTTGNDGGSFLVAGPGWSGEAPHGIKKALRADTELVMAFYRTQLFNPGDIDNVTKIQAGYQVQPLSAFLGQSAPKAAPTIDFLKPLTAEEEKTSLEFFNVLNFVLQFCPTLPSEKPLMARFAKIGVGAGQTFDPGKLSPELKKAIEDGKADAWQGLADLQKLVDAGKVTSGDIFGTRQYLKNNYLYRFAGAVLGIYGNSKQEAMYPAYFADAGGQPLNASKGSYVLRFAKDQLPPVNAFWSLTMYSLPDRLLVANPLTRYLINSPMLPGLKRDADGGLTLYVQKGSPGADKESNWLPAPDGPFFAILRLYLPKQLALDGTWKAPPLIVAPLQ
jgi:hypothetical protein